jgi:hypothetical protein
LTIRFSGLFIGWGEQGAVMLLGQGLPMKIPRTGQSGFARPFSTSVLMNHHAFQFFDPFWDPNGILYRKYEFAGFYRSFVSYPIVRWFRFW